MEEKDQEQEKFNVLPKSQDINVDVSEFSKSAQRPLWTYILLTASIMSVSSAATIFKYLSEVPSQTLASWRLQLTSVVLIPGFLLQYKALDKTQMEYFHQNLLYLIASGTCLAVHFGAWVAGVHSTSLPHALLIVAACPSMVMAGGMWLLRKPISWGELIGTVIGIIGCVILSQGAKVDREVSMLGDFYCFIAAIAFVGYALVGKRLRSHMPLFVYAFPVTCISAIQLTFWSFIFDQNYTNVLYSIGYFFNGRYFLCILWLALGPGMVGHTGFNLLLKYFSALVITVSYSLEPVFGSIMGWIVGLASIPTLLTWIGGFIVLLSAVVVNVSANKRQKHEAENVQEKQQRNRNNSQDDLDESSQGDDVELQSLINSN